MADSVQPRQPSRRSLHVLTVFWGAFLLFLVQPLIGKYILLVWWHAGGLDDLPVVFPMSFAGGYAYAHCLNQFLLPRKQPGCMAVCCYSVCTLPITPNEGSSPMAKVRWYGQYLNYSDSVWAFRTSSFLPPALVQAWFAVPILERRRIGYMRCPMWGHCCLGGVSVCGGALEHPYRAGEWLVLGHGLLCGVLRPPRVAYAGRAGDGF